MKRFCFLTGAYSRYDVLMYERQGKSLVEAGYKVTYIVCDDKPNEVSEGIEIISTGHKPKNRIDRFLNTRKILLKFAKQVDADIYQISDPELIRLVQPLKQSGKHVIFNMRENYPVIIKNKYYIPKLFRNFIGNWYGNKMQKELKKYDAVFTVTDYLLDIIKAQWEIKQSYLLTNFPRVNKNFNLTKEEYLRRPDTLCYEGTIYVASRQENVFKALEKIPEVHYILAGKIDENYSEIKYLPYWNKLEFIDGFKLSELKDIFARSTISNVFRDFGKSDGSLGVLKVFESMEVALPVLFADVPLYNKINDKYHCGICVNPNSVKSIENAIRYLVNNKEEAYQMGQNGRRAVIQEFNWERQAELYINVINNIIS